MCGFLGVILKLDKCLKNKVERRLTPVNYLPKIFQAFG